MAVGNKALNKFQISNAEGTPGTAEAATAILLYEEMSSLTQGDVFHQPVQDRGSLAKNIEQEFKVAEFAEMEMSGDLYDQLMVYMALNTIKGAVTPTQPNAGDQPNHHLWVFEPNLGSAGTFTSFTGEWGDQIQAFRSPYMVGTKFEIEGAASNEDDARVTFTWSWFCRGVYTHTFTAALTAPTTHQFFAMNTAKWFVDSSYAGIGGTQITDVLRGFKYTYESMYTPRFSASGQFYFSGVNEARKETTLELTMWRDNTYFPAELAKYKANPKTTSFQRIGLYGYTEMDSGEADVPYIYLDGAYRIREIPEMDYEDDTELVTLTYKGIQDPTSSKMTTVSVGTQLSALP